MDRLLWHKFSTETGCERAIRDGDEAQETREGEGRPERGQPERPRGAATRLGREGPRAFPGRRGLETLRHPHLEGSGARDPLRPDRRGPPAGADRPDVPAFPRGLAGRLLRLRSDHPRPCGQERDPPPGEPLPEGGGRARPVPGEGPRAPLSQGAPHPSRADHAYRRGRFHQAVQRRLRGRRRRLLQLRRPAGAQARRGGRLPGRLGVPGGAATRSCRSSIRTASCRRTARPRIANSSSPRTTTTA